MRVNGRTRVDSRNRELDALRLASVIRWMLTGVRVCVPVIDLPHMSKALKLGMDVIYLLRRVWTKGE